MLQAQSYYGNAFIQTMVNDTAVQARGGAGGDVHGLAARGVQGGGSELPHRDRIQSAFGGHDVGGVQAHVGGAASEAS